MEKLQKTAKGLDTLFKIAYRLSIIGIVFGCVMMVIMWILYLGDPDIVDLMRTDLDFGGIRFRLADSVLPARDFGFWFLILGSVVSIAGLPVFCLMIRSVRGILAPIREGRPFDESIVHHLKMLGWMVIANGIIGIAGSLILSGNMLPGYDLAELFLSDKITEVTTYQNFDLTFIIYALILFLLSYIFQYGAQLQQLSDETL